MQVDELLGWFADQHAAGVTVRGGKLRPPGRVREEGVRKGKGGKGAPAAPPLGPAVAEELAAAGTTLGPPVAKELRTAAAPAGLAAG